MTATTSHASATFVITPADADSNANGHQVNLTAGGDTEITVEVTAEDDNATETYTVTVTRAAAQTPQSNGAALVSNTGQTAGSTGGVGTNEWVQSFTTGPNSDGYDLSSIELDFSTLPSPALASSDFTVTIWSATAANPPLPGSPLHTLSQPGHLHNRDCRLQRVKRSARSDYNIFRTRGQLQRSRRQVETHYILTPKIAALPQDGASAICGITA